MDQFQIFFNKGGSEVCRKLYDEKSAKRSISPHLYLQRN